MDRPCRWGGRSGTRAVGRPGFVTAMAGSGVQAHTCVINKPSSMVWLFAGTPSDGAWDAYPVSWRAPVGHCEARDGRVGRTESSSRMGREGYAMAGRGSRSRRDWNEGSLGALGEVVCRTRHERQGQPLQRWHESAAKFATGET